jgi:GT2 family glycosyltransferase
MSGLIITASIVTYNTKYKDIDQLIDSISSSIIDILYVIDNSPTDSLKEFVEKLSPKVTYIYGQGNVGFGAAHNIAIQKAIEMDSQYHFVVNPDIIIKEDVVSPMVSYIQKESSPH